MAWKLRFQSSPLSEYADVSDDSDQPGFGQPYTLDDIDAIRNSSSGALEERRQQLRLMLDNLRSRTSMDETDEYGGLIEEVRNALSSMRESAENLGGAGVTGFDQDNAVLAPDEILERAEDEAAIEREEAERVR